MDWYTDGFSPAKELLHVMRSFPLRGASSVFLEGLKQFTAGRDC